MPIDVIERAAIDRQPAVRAGGDEPEDLGERRRRRRAPASRARGTISCLAVRSPSRSARCSRTCSSGSSSPPSRLSAMSSSISSGEWTWRCPVDATPSSRSSSAPLPFSSAIDGANRRSDHCIGSTVASAVRVGSCSASDFGTSSPRIIASTVRTSSTTAAAVDSAVSGSSPRPLSKKRRQPRRDAGSARRRRESGWTA